MKLKCNATGRRQLRQDVRPGLPFVTGGGAKAAGQPGASDVSSEIDAVKCTDLYYAAGSALSPANLNEAMRWQAARVAFLLRHGPNAAGPRGVIQSKPLRKALRAMEMAGWEAW